METVGSESGDKNHDVVVFQNQLWNKPHDKILIFDTPFIHENVYVGESIEEDHKANLMSRNFNVGAFMNCPYRQS